MIDIFNFMIEMVKGFTNNITIPKVIAAFFAYALLLSNTTLGFLLRLLSIWIIYLCYDMYAKGGNTVEGIKAAIAASILFYWPKILKYLLVLFTKLMEKISHKLEGIEIDHKNES